MNISLREITRQNVKAVCRLRVKPEQEKFVAPNGHSIAEAQFSDDAWHRAVYAEDEPVGFVMVSIDPANASVVRTSGSDTPPSNHNRVTLWKTFLWRFMIDGKRQGNGYGRRALELVIGHVRRLPNVNTFYTSHLKGDNSPENFYLNMGFKHTGQVEEDEHVMKLDLQPPFDTEGGDPVLIHKPSQEEIEFIGDQLDEFNKQQTGQDDFKPIRLVFRDTCGVIAGLKGVTGWNWLYIDTLWVRPDYRRSGFGRRLLDHAEQEARSRGCNGVCLSSYDFQAPDFYRRHGYSVFGQIDDYPKGHTMFFMTKQL